MVDNFAGSFAQLDSPASKAFAITPNDSVDLALTTRGIYAGATGDISVILDDDTVAVLFVGVPVGTTLAIRASRVRATGTTAANLVGLV